MKSSNSTSRVQIIKKRLKELMASEGEAQFAAQLKLLGQSAASYLDLCDTPAKCEEYLNRISVQVEEMEGAFADFDEYVVQLSERRTELYEAYGMSECSTFISSSPTRPVTGEALGRAQPGRRVAILSRVGIADVRRGFTGVNRPPFDEARLVSATCGGVDVHSLYAPNGRTLDDPHYLFKLVWLERLRTLVDPDRPAVLAGDFNVAPTDTDVYDPRRFRGKTHTSEPEREAIRALIDSGLVDVTRSHLPHPDTYTWWGYRPGQFDKNRGLRIDLALCTPPLAARVTDVWIDTGERADDQPQKPSDHAPVALTLA